MNDKNLVGRSLGRYHIVEPLGQGGMASVFKAFDTSLERDVAIKVIRPDMDETNGDEFLKRFQREARALAQLDHPYILKVLDYGEQDGLPYLVMPFVPGGTLKQKMGHPMPYPQAASLLAPIARALDYAHHQKIIHRDVKPANILISQSGAPLLSDFGIAKMLETNANTQLTATGVGIGTPDYMAPEQWMGQADPVTDIYSLGVVFFEMITGHRPYTADTPAAVLLKHLRDPLPRPKLFIPDLPDAVEQVMFKALAKEPANRFQDMGEFAKMLEKLARDEVALIEPMPFDQATLQGLDLTAKEMAPGAGSTRTVLSPTITPANHSRQETSTNPSAGVKIGLLVAGGLVLVTVVCFVIAGVLLASRTLMNQQAAAATSTTGITNPAGTAGNISSTATSQPGVIASPAAQETPVATLPPEAIPTLPPITAIDGFPEDIPLLTANNGDLITQNSQGMIMYTFTTNLTEKEVLDFYLGGMEKYGWKQINEMKSNNQIIYYYMKNEKRTVMVGVMHQDEKIFVTIMIPPIE